MTLVNILNLLALFENRYSYALLVNFDTFNGIRSLIFYWLVVASLPIHAVTHNLVSTNEDVFFTSKSCKLLKGSNTIASNLLGNKL